MKVVIAEKPSVAKDIANVLGANKKNDGYFEGNGYQVTYAFGHLFSLANPEEYNADWKKWAIDILPIIPNDFKLNLDKDKSKQFKIIKELFNNADEVINAGDAGREGELIQRWIIESAKYKGPVKRLWISSLTEEAIKKGFDNLIDASTKDNLFYAGQQRSYADWIVGLNGTRALTVSSGSQTPLSLGRVQTPILALICERFNENKNFNPQTYFVPFLNLTKSNINFKAKLVYDDYILDREKAQNIINFSDTKIKCSFAETKEKKETPPLLYDLTSLQADANKKFNYSAQKTLDLMQSLYETHKVLTYPRTSSRYISEDIFKTLPSLINTLNSFYDKEKLSILNLDSLNKKSVNDEKVSDHHAIIPTGKNASLNADEENIFNLVTNRFIAAFSDNCIKNNTKYIFSINGNDFVSTGSVIINLGWRKAENDLEEDKEENQNLPNISKDDFVDIIGKSFDENKTKPKPLYSEATLLKAMETAGKSIDDEELREAIKETGIGTPATRASIIETLFKRGFILREKKNIVPTDLGFSIYNQIKNLPISSAELTGVWESKLIKIEKGELNPSVFFSDICDFTKNLVDDISKIGGEIDINFDKIVCPKCKKGVLNENQKAFGCSDYKNGCDFVIWKNIGGKNISDKVIKDLVEHKKSKLIKGFKSKEGKSFDAFLKIDDNFKVVFDFDKNIEVKNDDKEEKLSCPKCEKGNIIEQQKLFGCSEFKNGCDFLVWKNIAGKNISEKIVKELIDNKKTKLIKGFKSKENKEFDAFLKIDDKFKVVFEFDKK